MINEALLVASLFFPRISLLVAYVSGLIPFNTVPFIGDFALTVLFPRVLMLIYIYQNQGIDGWFVIHLIFLLIFWGGGSSATISKAND